MPRIATTVDRDLDRRLRTEARQRGITRARLLREAAIHYLGVSEGASGLAELRRKVAEQEARIAWLERQAGIAVPRQQLHGDRHERRAPDDD